MAIKKCYRLQANYSLFEGISIKWANKLYDIDEDYLSKVEYNKRAKSIVEEINNDLGAEFTIADVFGECRDIGWRYCTKCGDSFWSSENHEC